MYVYIALKIAAMIALVYSYKYLRKSLSSLECIGYYFMISAYEQIILNIISLNKDLIAPPENTLNFWLVQMDHLVISPFLTLWLLSYLLDKNHHPFFKLLVIIIWGLSLFLLEWLNQFFKLSHWNNWDLFISLTLSFSALVFSVVTSFLLRSLMRKEGLLK